MNGNRNLGMGSKYKVDNQPDFSGIDGMQQYTGPAGAGASLQTGNQKSTSFFFEAKALSPDKPLSHSTDTSTSLLGARSGMGQLPGMGA